MITEELIIKYYTYFYKKRFNSYSYKFSNSEKSKKVIQTFLKILDKKYNLKLIGEEFLWDYFVYSFNYWRNAELTAFHGKFRIELIIGKKAFERFTQNEKDDHWLIQKSEIISLYNLRKNDLISIKNDVYKGDHETRIKELFFNTQEGFYQCISNTTLYNHNHKCCMLCNFKADCKKILKEKIPNVYKQRGYL